jgi:hypothetical protein
MYVDDSEGWSKVSSGPGHAAKEPDISLKLGISEWARVLKIAAECELQSTPEYTRLKGGLDNLESCRSPDTMSAEKIKVWLDSLEVPYEYDEGINTFKTEWDVEGKPFEVRITIRADRWILVAVRLLNAEGIPSDNREELLAFLLQENYMLDDVTYSMDEKGNIYSENDIPEQASFDDFTSEFDAVVFGMMRFFDSVSARFGIEP